jgi:serine/threonine protein phosphatase PrpC
MLVDVAREVEAHVATDMGPTRDNNEDCCAFQTIDGESGVRCHLLIVADGLGGHRAGEVASRLAVDTVLREAEREGAPIGDRFLGRALQQANLAVFNHGHDDPDCFNMQTTLTALAVQYDRLLLAHVGDCRAFRVRGDTIQQLTTDHTRVTEMLRMRLITPEQAIKHPARNMLTRSLGAELLLQVDTARDTVAPGDIYVICSDGLWSEVTSEEIRRTVTNLAPERACHELLELGTLRNATDNMTVGVLRVHQVAPAPATVPRWKSWLGRGG